MKKVIPLVCLSLLHFVPPVYSQTESDGLKMSKNNFCSGLNYNYSSWINYWEGTFKRHNANLGKVSSQAVALMGNYGISERFNIIFSLPYVQTHATAGTLKGQKGLQDLSVFVKWLAFEKSLKKGTISLYSVIGGSTPTTNYAADFLPLSIGLKSRTLNIRPIIDYQLKNLFVTVSGNYIHRYNIKVERNAYYTDKLIYSNEVFMPNVFSSKFGIGYRKEDMIFELVIDTWNTLGGFDIRKNDMPFPSNKMNMARAGVNIKFPFKKPNGLALVANSFYTLGGRNVGQSSSIMVGLFYVVGFGSKKDLSTQTQK